MGHPFNRDIPKTHTSTKRRATPVAKCEAKINELNHHQYPRIKTKVKIIKAGDIIETFQSPQEAAENIECNSSSIRRAMQDVEKRVKVTIKGDTQIRTLKSKKNTVKGFVYRKLTKEDPEYYEYQ